MEEHELKYLLKCDQGTSVGLFLDQRINRYKLLKRARDARVLNLFCYTAGFSLCAAKAGARNIVNVDSSQATLEWARENAALNSFPDSLFEYWASDARSFVDGCIRRKRTFDFIICDPPSFSRGKKSIFKVEKDFAPLAKNLYSILRPGGLLICSCNYEKWKQTSFEAELKKALPRSAIFEERPKAEWDLAFPGEEPQLKCLFIVKGK